LYTNLKKVKRKNVNLTSRVKSTNQDYGNHGITATLQKHYHYYYYYYESRTKIHNITETITANNYSNSTVKARYSGPLGSRKFSTITNFHYKKISFYSAL